MLILNGFGSRAGWRLAAAAGIAALLLAIAAPALAITYGEFDGDDHPSVGSMVFSIPGRGLFQWCTGTLIGENVFLTASHCTWDVDVYLERYPGSEMLVTFDPVIDASATFYTGTRYTHPDYTNFQGQGGRSDPHDIAVIVLDQSPGIAPASLPQAGLLDALQASHELKDTTFTAVGYGTIRNIHSGGPANILDNAERRRVDQQPVALTPAWLMLSMNYHTGNGGTCYGDSGGPHFIHLGGEETNIVASITVTGDIPCVASDVTYRTDTESARAFLDDFVALP
jgi:hypothetical protein